MSRKAFAVILKPLIDLHGEPKGWDQKIDIYYAALCDLPERLLDTAVKHAIAANEFFPKPAWLRASIADELYAHRQLEKLKLENALPPPLDLPPPTQEDRDYVAQLVRSATAALKRMQECDNAA